MWKCLFLVFGGVFTACTGCGLDVNHWLSASHEFASCDLYLGYDGYYIMRIDGWQKSLFGHR